MDLISRQAAIDAIENEQKKIMRSDWAIDQAKFSAMSDIRALIEDLPSVNPQKTGHFVRWYEVEEKKNGEEHIPHCKCSECGTIFRSEMFQIKRKGEYVWDIEESKFCPRCGVKMGGNDDEQNR